MKPSQVHEGWTDGYSSKREVSKASFWDKPWIYFATVSFGLDTTRGKWRSYLGDVSVRGEAISGDTEAIAIQALSGGHSRSVEFRRWAGGGHRPCDGEDGVVGSKHRALDVDGLAGVGSLVGGLGTGTGQGSKTINTAEKNGLEVTIITREAEWKLLIPFV